MALDVEGVPLMRKLFVKVPWPLDVGNFLTWFPPIFETLFPIVYFLGFPYTWLYCGKKVP